MRISDSDKRALIYGINETKEAFLLLIDLDSQIVLAIVNFTHRQAWHLRDLAFIPGSHEKAVTCGVD